MTPEWVARFHQGDNDVFAQLVREHTPRLLAVAMRLTASRVAAEDLVHDAWVRAFYRRESFTGTGTFVGWMFAILRSCHVDEMRRVQRTRAREDVYARDTATEDVTADDEKHATPGEVLDTLSGLTERQRDVIVLRLLDGLSVADTGKRLGIADGTVKATLSQALKRIRHLLETSRHAPS